MVLYPWERHSVILGEKKKTWFVFKMIASHIYRERNHKFPKETFKEKGKGHGFVFAFVNQEKNISPLLFPRVKHCPVKMWKVLTFAYYSLILRKWLQELFLYNE